MPDDRAPRTGASGLILDGIERWTGLTLGLTEVVTGYSQRTLAAAQGVADADAADEVTSADLVRALPGALAALALRTQHAAFDAVALVERQGAAVAERVGASRAASPAVHWLYGLLSPLDAEFKADQAERAEIAQVFLASAGPQTLEELLARVDLNALLAEIDLDEIVARVDLDAILDRVDLNELLERVDLQAVLERVDVDAAVDRVDLDRVVARLDVNDLMSGVIQEIEVAGLVRDSTGALASSTVAVLRNPVGGAVKFLGRRPPTE